MEKLFCPSCGREYDGDAKYCLYDGTRLIRRSEDTLAGEVFDERYEVLHKIAEGGMGAVYKARQLSTGKDVAIKMISRDLTKSSETVKRFRREVELQLRLSHPNIVTVIDISQTKEGDYYFVMEYVEGKSLKRLILEKGPLPLSLFYELAFQMCDAIHYAHMKGIIHRDLKPENIIVVSLEHQNIVKIVDFGIAKALQGGGKRATTLTQVGRVLGTPAYMSPEQARGEIDKISHRSDLYSLGVIFYQMLSGRLPFESDTPWGLMHKHINEAPVPLRKINPSVSESLDNVIMRLLEKEPENRYPSANSLKQDLMKVAGIAPGKDEEVDRDIEVKADLPHDTVPIERGRKGRGILWGGIVVLILLIQVVSTTGGYLMWT